VDPKKDIDALREELDLGLTSWPDAVSARGEDPEAHIAEIERWNARLVQAGMPVGRGRIAQMEAAPAADDGEPGAVPAAQQE
jgi:capsid protein